MTVDAGGPSKDSIDLSSWRTAIRAAVDAYEFERLWSKGLSLAESPHDRDEVLAEAGNRLERFVAGDRTGVSGIDRRWLRLVVDAVRSSEDERSRELRAVTQRVIRSAFARAEQDLAIWHRSRQSGEAAIDFVRRHPTVAASLRDLGHIARSLRGTGMLTLVSPEDLGDAATLLEALEAPAVVAPLVGEWLRVTRDELLAWAKSDGAPGLLPHLVRRLVSETALTARWISFPGGTGVTSSGWDGVVDATEPTRFVPSGRSVWELSVSSAGPAKAHKDFAKRVDAVPTELQRQMTYVQVICQPWKGASDLASAVPEAEFKEVRGYNVDVLEAWLETAPATTVWFRELIGFHLDGVLTVERWWKQWLASTSIPLDERFVLAGRSDASRSLRHWLRTGREILTIGGDVRAEEIRAFVAAACNERSDDDPGVLPEVLYVDDRQVARRLLSDAGTVSVLVSSVELAREVPAATKHRVMVPVPGSETADIVLPSLDGGAVRELLRSQNVDSFVATDLGALARRSLLALRRTLALQRDLYRPSWASRPGLVARRSVLLNSWNATREADVRAVEQMLEMEYSSAEDALSQLSRSGEDDPLLAVVDERWHVVAAADALLLIGGALGSADLSAFESLCLQVLPDVDPLAALPAERRLVASLDGATARYSAYLRRGLARTLAILGSLDTRAASAAARTGQVVADSVVGEITRRANEDESFDVWTALAPHLPLLAEAAPDVFLGALRRGLSGPSPGLAKMFADGEPDRFGAPKSSPHTNFLWALETLAWSGDYLGSVTAILGQLQDLDPGGLWANRPIGSLESIFRPWHPNTSASVDARSAALRLLRRQHPDVAWTVLLSMLPNSHGTQLLQRGPEFRDWKRGEPVVEDFELQQVIGDVSAAVLEDVGQDPERLLSLVKRIADLPRETRSAFVLHLIELAQQPLTASSQLALWEELRQLVAMHREFADATWVLPEADLSELDSLVSLLEPESGESKHAWLFAYGMISLPGVSRKANRGAFRSELEREREGAIRDVAKGGWAALMNFAKTVEAPRFAGGALASAVNGEFDAQALESLATTPPGKDLDFTVSYLEVRFHQAGWNWLDAALAKPGLASQTRAALLRLTGSAEGTILRARELGDEVYQSYFEALPPYGMHGDLAAIEAVVAGLQSVRRHGAALEVLSNSQPKEKDAPGFAELVAAAFEGMMSATSRSEDDSLSLREYDLDSLLEILWAHVDAVGPQRVASIEWYLLPALGFEPRLRALDQALSMQPEFFAEMVTLVYRPESEDANANDERTDADRNLSMNAFRLLRAWRGAPGVEEDGVPGEGVRQWVLNARRLLAAADRQRSGDDHVGQALTRVSSASEDWPPLVVRALLEELDSDDVDAGFAREVFNGRGVTMRSLEAGGAQERVLADRYWSIARQFGAWPRTFAIFSDLARSYEHDARREDSAAELRRRGLDH